MVKANKLIPEQACLQKRGLPVDAGVVKRSGVGQRQARTRQEGHSNLARALLAIRVAHHERVADSGCAGGRVGHREVLHQRRVAVASGMDEASRNTQAPAPARAQRHGSERRPAVERSGAAQGLDRLDVRRERGALGCINRCANFFVQVHRLDHCQRQPEETSREAGTVLAAVLLQIRAVPQEVAGIEPAVSVRDRLGGEAGAGTTVEVQAENALQAPSRPEHDFVRLQRAAAAQSVLAPPECRQAVVVANRAVLQVIAEQAVSLRPDCVELIRVRQPSRRDQRKPV